jgi:hypothetical protein
MSSSLDQPVRVYHDAVHRDDQDMEVTVRPSDVLAALDDEQREELALALYNGPLGDVTPFDTILDAVHALTPNAGT